jgi:hypothetical protein
MRHNAQAGRGGDGVAGVAGVIGWLIGLVLKLFGKGEK